jgi:hypothetical protein
VVKIGSLLSHAGHMMGFVRGGATMGRTVSWHNSFDKHHMRARSRQPLRRLAVIPQAESLRVLKAGQKPANWLPGDSKVQGGAAMGKSTSRLFCPTKGILLFTAVAALSPCGDTLVVTRGFIHAASTAVVSLPPFVLQRKSCSVIHIRCRMTASFRATAIRAIW